VEPTEQSSDVVREVEIPEDSLATLREVFAIVRDAMADLGEAHLQESKDRRRYEASARVLKAAEESANHAKEHAEQVKQFVASSLAVGDGAWEMNLETGKLVRTDVGTGD